MLEGPVKIYRSRGPVQNAWGVRQGHFSCLLHGFDFVVNEHAIWNINFLQGRDHGINAFFRA